MKTLAALYLLFGGAFPVLAAGTVNLDNRPKVVGGEGARFYDDGGNFLEGPRYVAQLYAGQSEDRLVSVGASVPFLTGEQSGYFRGPDVAIPFIEDLDMAWVQVRAWDGAGGATFEDAATSGYWSGISSILYVRTGGNPGGVPVPGALLRGLLYPGGPVILRHPASAKIRVGSAVALSVVASGGVAVSYRWYEGKSGDFDRPSLGGTNAIHVVSPLSTTAYWVQVFTAAGSTNSASATVSVVPRDSVLLNLRVEEQVPTLLVDGPPGLAVQLQFGSALGMPAWTDFVKVALKATPVTVVDSNAVGSHVRLYRGVVTP